MRSPSMPQALESRKDDPQCWEDSCAALSAPSPGRPGSGGVVSGDFSALIEPLLALCPATRAGQEGQDRFLVTLLTALIGGQTSCFLSLTRIAHRVQRDPPLSLPATITVLEYLQLSGRGASSTTEMVLRDHPTTSEDLLTLLQRPWKSPAIWGVLAAAAQRLGWPGTSTHRMEAVLYAINDQTTSWPMTLVDACPSPILAAPLLAGTNAAKFTTLPRVILELWATRPSAWWDALSDDTLVAVLGSRWAEVRQLALLYCADRRITPTLQCAVRVR